MSEPEGSRKKLKTSSQPDDATTASTSPLLCLTPDLILRIALLLEARDLLSLGTCNKLLYSISQDGSLWRGLLHGLRPPLPRTLRSRPLDDLPHSDLKETVLYSLMVEGLWLKQREDRTLLQMDGHPGIGLLRFLDDRWVISIPTRGPPAIWDTQENPPSRSHGSVWHDFQGWATETEAARAAVDPLQGDIIIALKRASQPTLRILRVHLADPRTGRLQLTVDRSIGNLNPEAIGLEPSRNAVIVEASGTGMQIVDWIRNQVVQVTGPPIPEDFEFTLGVRLVGDYILSFRSRCIELLSIPPFANTSEQTDPTFYRFHLEHSEDIFEDASLSEAQPNQKSSNDSLVVYILAYLAPTGFFYFRVTIHNPHYVPSGPKVGMDVDLLGFYDLYKPQTGLREGVEPRVSSEALLGPQGKRGLWIEQTQDESTAFVVAASFDQNPSEIVTVKSGDDLEELCEIAPQIESVDIFHIDNGCIPVKWDFSEVTGKIVLKMDNQIILL